MSVSFRNPTGAPTAGKSQLAGPGDRNPTFSDAVDAAAEARVTASGTGTAMTLAGGSAGENWPKTLRVGVGGRAGRGGPESETNPGLPA